MNRSRGGGYALITVLWLVTLLTAVTATYHAAARVESKQLSLAVYRAEADSIAEAAVWIVVRDHLLTGQPADRPANLHDTVTFRGTAVDVSFVDAAGKVNLNMAQGDLLGSLLANAGVAPADKAALVDAIADWRDTDHVRATGGFEDDDYARAGSSHGASDAPFGTVDELRYVKGMTDDVFRKIAPLLTVYGDQTRVNVEAAPAEVLRALPGADERIVAELLRKRAAPAAGRVIGSEGLDVQFIQTSPSDVYVVTAVTKVGGVSARIEATVRYAVGDREPLQVLGWESYRD